MSDKIDLRAIRDLAKALNRPIETLIVLENDPFYVTETKQREAEWFAALLWIWPWLLVTMPLVSRPSASVPLMMVCLFSSTRHHTASVSRSRMWSTGNRQRRERAEGKGRSKIVACGVP
jgi:hypothetical protein